MARTKKQTLENASERKRQIQEEIRRETLAAKEKKENLWSHVRENHSAGETNQGHNGVGGPGASLANFRAGIIHGKTDNRGGVFNINVKNAVGHSASVMSQSNMSAQSTDNAAPALNDGGLPKVIICIPDICRSPSKGQEEGGKIPSDIHCVKSATDSFQKKYGSSKQSGKCSLPEDVVTSLKSLKAASEKVREEKSKKARHEAHLLSKSTAFPTPSHGWHSPQQHSPSSCDLPQSSTKRGHKDPQPLNDEKPKINIFTDTLGIDLGKRIRSPRRLSEDMIALPIFSVRRWSSSIENCSASYTCGKSADEALVTDQIENLSLHSDSSSFNTSVNGELLDRLNVSPILCHKFSSCDIEKASPLSEGSSRFIMSDDPLPDTSSKISESPILMDNQFCMKASEHLQYMEADAVASIKSESQQLKTERSPEIKLLKSCELKTSNSPDSREFCPIKGEKSLNLRLEQSNNEQNISDSTDKIDYKTDGHLEGKKTQKSPSLKVKKEKLKSKISREVEELMSSICREIMSDGIVIKQEDGTISDIDNSATVDGDILFNKEMALVNGSISFKKVTTDVADETATSLNSGEEIQVRGAACHIPEEKHQSSLLCAMLVGGTEVADSYSQERVKVKTQTLETSHLDMDNVIGSSGCEVMNSQVGSPDLKKTQVFIKSEVQDFIDEKSSDSNRSSFSRQVTVMTGDSSSDGEDVNGSAEAENTPSNVALKGKINLSSQLKKLNENVLKLMEIDLEEEFLQDLEIDEPCVEESSGTLSQGGLSKTSLYSLISNLAGRLRVNDSCMPFSTPVDIELVEKLMQSCPKTSPSIVPKLKTLSRITRMFNRLQEEELRETCQVHNRKNGEDKSESNLGAELDSSKATKITQSDSEKAFLQMLKNEFLHKAEFCEALVNKSAAGESDVQIFSDPVSSTMNKLMSPVITTGSDAPDSASNICVNESLHDTDLNDKISDSDGVDENEVKTDTEHISELPKASICDDAETLSSSAKSHNFNENKSHEISSRHTFQKSKTCDDSQFSVPSCHAKTLRRVNSSPQMSTKVSLFPLSPTSPVSNCTKETYVKSKLGSKIPIPGTSYVTKLRKSWRIPRSVVEPKPLSVLTELEKSAEPGHVFTCHNLHKYLSIPSNRVIVTPEMQEEMKIMDAKAKEEEEMREKMMLDNEEKDRKIEEEINSEYKNYEPDFDEVDGMLFMSFSSEVELKAHVRVEKALEWDKDDTMLRVSRAKAFEDAKIHNVDMGHFKLKHLRGQHMRWKKYRRLYSDEVKALLNAQASEISADNFMTPKKTSDVSKIKGWKRKSASLLETSSKANQNHLYNDSDVDLFSGSCDTKLFGESFADDMSDNISSLDLSPQSKRRQGFSHQKAHKQLFKELKMDWEDRMIHRKLGGWSLKGNRPQAFSSAAKKRREMKSRETDVITLDIKDINSDVSFFEENEADQPDAKTQCDSQKKKKIIKIIYPLLTEKMAKNALKTLETGDIQRSLRKKKRSGQTTSQLPDLTPVIFKIEHGTFKTESSCTPISEATVIGSSSESSCLTPSAQNYTPSTSTATFLEVELQEEPVMEGVDIASENMSSPSITDTSSLKSCSKPGCRYGCICHLCSVSETLAPLPSPITKLQTPACDKEYCRLGCICESIDPEKPVPDKTHCRKPSCMLQCICSEMSSFDENEDIPYLPSMRRRPKPGERFSNLPQRERTHRSAKNLDAVTRKAMMLYETSEIYCEKVERVRKRPEICSSPPETSADFTSQISTTSSVPHTGTTYSTSSFDIDIASEPSDDGSLHADVMFTAETTAVSEISTAVSAHQVTVHQAINSSDAQNQYSTRQNTRTPKPAFILDDIRQTVPIIEPSAHKRKRKSHPLSNEIFTSSTCARTQPFKHIHFSKDMQLSTTDEETGDVIEISPPASADSKQTSQTITSVSCKILDSTVTEINSECQEVLPKILSVHTLASEPNKIWDNAGAEIPLTESLSVPASVSRKRTRSSTTDKQASPPKNVNSDDGSHMKQHYGWHRSMVCLKARAPPVSQDPGEEDIKEEDEVKLLEFLANCNWEGAKREVLARVAQCLTRGQYPQPRTMNVCEFVVEILPKAVQPSSIPPELRAKLPGQMYSVRVRITRRESVSTVDDDSDVIDLSTASPVKSPKGSNSGDPPFKSVARNLKDSLLSAEPKPPSTSTSTDSSFMTSSSVGISGLSKLFITSSPVTGMHNQSSSTCFQNVKPAASKPVSAPGSRRSSLESTPMLSFSDDQKQTTDFSVFPAQTTVKSCVKMKGSSFMRLGSGSSLKTSTSSKSVTSSTALVKSKTKSVKNSNHPLMSKAVSSSVPSILVPFNAKDVKYMIPGKDGTMQLVDVPPTVDKNKKLIAVPITLSKTSVNMKGKQGTVVALPVSGAGQSRMIPVVNSQSVPNQLKGSAAQQIVLRLPGTPHTGVLSPVVSGVRHPVVLQPLQSIVKGQPPRFQVVPLQIGSCVAVPQTKQASSKCSKSAVLTPKPLKSTDEMIMVFDASHIKPTKSADPSTSLQTNSYKVNQVEDFVRIPLMKKARKDSLLSVTDLTSLETPLNASIDLTEEDMSSEDQHTVLKDTSMDAESVDENLHCDSFASDQLENTDVGCSDVSGECGASLEAPSANNSLEDCTSYASHQCQHEQFTEINQCSEAAEGITTCAQLSKAENLNESKLGTEVTSPENTFNIVSASPRDSSPSALFISDVNTQESLIKVHEESVLIDTKRQLENVPKTSEESALSATKIHLLTTTAQENLPPCTNKPGLIPESSVVLDEDSMTSMHSVLGMQISSASPLSSIDRPKSVMSGGLSTGSSDDLLLMLSSEDDIDVGEDDFNQSLISIRVRAAERALENDHGSMCTRVEQTDNWPHNYMKKIIPTKEERFKLKASRHEDRDATNCSEKETFKGAHRDIQKVKHHNQLERLRRFRMRILFDELQQQVMKERGVVKDHAMSKVQVLSEAKKVVLHLNKRVQQGNELVEHYERTNKRLMKKLNQLKENMLQQNVSEETMNSVLKAACKKYFKNSTNTSVAGTKDNDSSQLQQPHTGQSIKLEDDVDGSLEMVNLVSPSTEEENVSDRVGTSTPVYEDISDPEDAPVSKHDVISEEEEISPRRESVIDSNSVKDHR